MSIVTEELKAKAEVYYGHEKCKEKSQELLREVGLPNGLLPMREIEECGIVRETGFVWLKQKKAITHKFEKISKNVSYATEVTAIAEPNRIKKLTGVKAKELLIWITLNEISVDAPPSDAAAKITFKTPTGLSRQFPVSAFIVEEEAQPNKKEEAQAQPVKEEEEPKDTAAKGKEAVNGTTNVVEVKEV